MYESDGVTILYNANNHLSGTRSYKNRASWKLLQFADDTAVFSSNIGESSASKLFEMTSRYGPTISNPKTKAMVVGGQQELQTLEMNGMEIEVVEEFKYLGSIIRNSGSCIGDMVESMASSSCTFGRMKRSVFQNKALSTRNKCTMYKGVASYECSSAWDERIISSQM